MGNKTLDVRVLELEEAVRILKDGIAVIADSIEWRERTDEEIAQLRDSVKFLTKVSNRKGVFGDAVKKG